MHRAVGGGKAFDRHDRRALRLHGEDVARLHRAAVEVDRARAALRGVAADVRPGESEVHAQEIDEQHPRFDVRR